MSRPERHLRGPGRDRRVHDRAGGRTAATDEARPGRSPVPLKARLAYSAPAFALAFVGIPVYVYVPKFYTDVVGVPVAVLGLLVLAVRAFDAVTDPLIGWVSDRTRSSMGRRRPFLLLASPLLALAVWLLLVPPRLEAPEATAWFGVCIFAVFLFWTLVTVPYESLGPEISFDYDERTAILGLRDGLLIAGTLAAAAAPVAVARALGLPDDDAGQRARLAWVAGLYAPLLVGSCLWCVVALRELPLRRCPGRSGFLGVLGPILDNRPFLILLASYAVGALGSNLPATLLLYYVEYVLESQLAELFLVEYLTTGVVFLPAWVALSGRIGKKATWIASMAVNTGAFSGVFFLGAGDVVAYAMLVFLSGIGLGATLAIPSAMQADVIDYDELLSGERREGRYVGLWSISRKLAAALGVGLALTTLGATGYAPNLPQTPTVRTTLRVLYALVPVGCNVVALGIALFYPIGRSEQQQILEAIEARRRGEAVTDPLRPGRLLEATA